MSVRISLFSCSDLTRKSIRILLCIADENTWTLKKARVSRINPRKLGLTSVQNHEKRKLYGDKKRLEPGSDARSLLSIARVCCSVFCEEMEGERED